VRYFQEVSMWHKHDVEAVGGAGVVVGLCLLIIGLAITSATTAGIGLAALFAGLYLLKDK